MGNLSDDEDINRAWENIKENIKTSAKKILDLYEVKQHKPGFDEECLGFLDQRLTLLFGFRIWKLTPRVS